MPNAPLSPSGLRSLSNAGGFGTGQPLAVKRGHRTAPRGHTWAQDSTSQRIGGSDPGAVGCSVPLRFCEEVAGRGRIVA